MRGRAGLVGVCLVAAVLLTACGDGSAARRTTDHGRSAAPRIGGPTPSAAPVPQHRMGDLEQQVARDLSRRLAGSGLHLQGIDCPHWDGEVPRRMRCRGYVDGIEATVRVRLSTVVHGRSVGFDASLGDGVLATRSLERTVVAAGWSRADCGRTPAYRARVGTRIVCRVEGRGGTDYVVATIRSRAGAVTLADDDGS